MSSLSTTYAAVAEDAYRRERAAHGWRAVGGVHHHLRFAAWRERRRGGRPASR